MSPNIKLTYFDKRGRVEPARLAFVVGRIDFEDERVGDADWMAMKPKTPYGALPTMEVDGKLVAQSGAIIRYAGKLSGLYPEDAMKMLKIEEVLGALQDLSMAIFGCIGSDREQLKAEREKAVKEAVPRYWGGLEKRMGELSGGDGPYLLGEEASIADIAIVTVVNSLKQGIVDFVPIDVLDDAPILMRIYKAVMERADVKEWYCKHPIPNVTE